MAILMIFRVEEVVLLFDNVHDFFGRDYSCAIRGALQGFK
jgi:hypothetical protein